MNDVELAKFIPAMTFPGTRAAVEEYVAKESRNPAVVFLAIVEKETGRHVGQHQAGGPSAGSTAMPSMVVCWATSPRVPRATAPRRCA